MPRNTGGVRSRPNFRPGGSNYTDRSFNTDLDCKDLHAFGNIVCNGEQRVQGNIMSGGMHVGDSGVLKVPVVHSAPGPTTPADHPTHGGLVMVNVSDDGKMYFSRHDGLHIAMTDAQDKHAGAVAAHDAIDTVVAADPADNGADVAAAQAAVDALPTGNAKFEEGRADVRAGIATDLATSKTNADNMVTSLNTAKTTAETSANGHGPFEWVAVN